MTSAKEAELQTGISHQSISRWLDAPGSAEIRAFVAQKNLRAAAEAADALPTLIERLRKRAEKLLDDDTVAWNGTQLQAAATAVGILWTHVHQSLGQGTGRFGTSEREAAPLDLSALDTQQ